MCKCGNHGDLDPIHSVPLWICARSRGQYIVWNIWKKQRALPKYKLPLNEIIYDFFDALKSRSRGYASLDYELCGYEESELVKLDILVNKKRWMRCPLLFTGKPPTSEAEKCVKTQGRDSQTAV